ncbi:MAG: UDP-N-acetylmuramate--L-alanine ligase [Firmicutes bacterium]|nr:UDP-N-acetylmuramate--L-alanine ligase [Bacillota bacterium]
MKEQKNIHFIGCRGVSMQRLMKIAKGRGDLVSGSDVLLGGHDKKNIHSGIDLVVFSAAIKEDNAELVRARELGIEVMSRGEYLAKVMEYFDISIAVGGAHGKTTTTAMMSEVLAALNPTVHIGVDNQCAFNDDNLSLDTNFVFITEACEYKKSFLELKPDIAIVLNMDLDHTDCYENLEAAKLAFYEFIDNAKKVAIVGDEFVRCKMQNAKDTEKQNIIRVGLKPSCDIRAGLLRHDENGCYSFCLFINKQWKGRFRLKVAGRHNVINSLFVIVAALELGLSLDEIRIGLERFKGISRRFEKLGQIGTSTIYSDYAHHPKEIDASIASMRECGYKHLTICFEPHTYTRTQSFYKEFGASLSKADEVVLLPIFAAREQKVMGVESNLIEKEMKRAGYAAVICADDYMNACEYLKNHCLIKDSAVVFMGAGTIDNLAREFIINFQNKEG